MVFLCLIWVYPASAEYYQYADEDGNLHFTDNMAEVPEKYRTEIEKHRSVKKEKTSGISAADKRGRSAEQAVPDAKTLDGKLKIEAGKLEKERQRLQKDFQKIQEEKENLLEQAEEEMTAEERRAYQDRVRELNSRIDKYHEKRERFQEKKNSFTQTLRQPPGRAAE
ncbi:MAG: DUF4124 domain-containing protein [Desulfosalsimonadaceae bacterium]